METNYCCRSKDVEVKRRDESCGFSWSYACRMVRFINHKLTKRSGEEEERDSWERSTFQVSTKEGDSMFRQSWCPNVFCARWMAREDMLVGLLQVMSVGLQRMVMVGPLQMVLAASITMPKSILRIDSFHYNFAIFPYIITSSRTDPWTCLAINLILRAMITRYDRGTAILRHTNDIAWSYVFIILPKDSIWSSVHVKVREFLFGLIDR
jgi:hypothetical protein